MNELNQKHSSINFDYKFDWKQIEFLETLVPRHFNIPRIPQPF